MTIDAKVRAKALARTYGVCVYCGQRSRGGLDHLVPSSRRGADELDNLLPCCRSCNSGKSNRTLEEFRHSAALRILDWPPFTRDEIAWLRGREFDLQEYDGFQFHFEKSRHKCMATVRELVARTLKRQEEEAWAAGIAAFKERQAEERRERRRAKLLELGIRPPRPFWHLDLGGEQK